LSKYYVSYRVYQTHSFVNLKINFIIELKYFPKNGNNNFSGIESEEDYGTLENEKVSKIQKNEIFKQKWLFD
jgi:hypothetical protein